MIKDNDLELGRGYGQSDMTAENRSRVRERDDIPGFEDRGICLHQSSRSNGAWGLANQQSSSIENCSLSR